MRRSTERLASSIFSPLIDPDVSSTTAIEMGARATFISDASAASFTSANTDVDVPESTPVWLSDTMPCAPGPENDTEFFPAVSGVLGKSVAGPSYAFAEDL